jgi:hypothetical protein
MNMKIWSFIIAFFSLFFVLSQEDDGISVYTDMSSREVGEIIPKHTFNVIVGLPNTVVNKPFRRLMVGIVDVNPYYQFSLRNSIVFGAGVRYTLFKVNEFKTPVPIYGMMHSFGGFVKIGYEKFITTRFAVDFSVKVGFMGFSVDTDLNKNLHNGIYRYDAGFVEPTMGFILSATERSSYRLVFGYTVQSYAFKLSQIGTLNSGGYSIKENKRPTQFITFGLGYTHYFGKVKN